MTFIEAVEGIVELAKSHHKSYRNVNSKIVFKFKKKKKKKKKNYSTCACNVLQEPSAASCF